MIGDIFNGIAFIMKTIFKILGYVGKFFLWYLKQLFSFIGGKEKQKKKVSIKGEIL